MVVEFTTNLIDSSYLGRPMVFKKGLKKNKHAKKQRIFHYSYQKNIQIF
jgi:hypothetical protein